MKHAKSLLLTTIMSLTTALSAIGQLTPAQKEEWRAEVKEKLAANQPIVFCGKVVDQFDEPVAGVKVMLTVSSWFDPSGKGDDWDQQEDDYTLITNAQGRFDFRGKKGTSIRVELQRKDGYLYGEYPFSHPGIIKDFDFSFDPTWDHPNSPPIHRPDPNRPVIFHVWKAQGGEAVVEWGPGKEIGRDGTFIAVDLLGLEFRPADSAAADFRVALKADIPLNAGPDYKCRWSVRIEAVDGGLVLTDDEYMYLAPDGGYQPNVEFAFDPANADWDSSKTFRFYLRSGGGRHCARVVLTVSPRVGRDTGRIRFTSTINLTGSRNLEEGRVLSYVPRNRVDFARGLYP